MLPTDIEPWLCPPCGKAKVCGGWEGAEGVTDNCGVCAAATCKVTLTVTLDGLELGAEMVICPLYVLFGARMLGFTKTVIVPGVVPVELKL
jgi:hypothetical protein